MNLQLKFFPVSIALRSSGELVSFVRNARVFDDYQLSIFIHVCACVCAIIIVTKGHGVDGGWGVWGSGPFFGRQIRAKPMDIFQQFGMGRSVPISCHMARKYTFKNLRAHYAPSPSKNSSGV